MKIMMMLRHIRLALSATPAKLNLVLWFDLLDSSSYYSSATAAQQPSAFKKILTLKKLKNTEEVT